MHRFLSFLAKRRLTQRAQYGLPIVLVGLATLLRLVAPLDIAPFLLYLPIIVFVALSVGWGPGSVGTALSTVIAAGLFMRSNETATLTVGQVVALCQYVIVGATMVVVASALRRAIIDNEVTLGRVDETNRVLVESRESLLLAKREAEAAREEAEVAKEAAEGANRAKSSFLANMSHELRTPLSAVIGYSEMMEEEVEDLGETGLLADLGKIKSNARHLLSLINDVLDLSKIEANRMDTSAEDVEVATLVEEAASTVGALVGQKNNQLVVEVAPDVGAMHTDVVKLRQCLFNLLSNASKFTENGRITLHVHREGEMGAATLLFRIADTGIGMTEEQIGRLFQRFSQADEATTRKFGGTGLGLAITRAFAQLLGGDIAVESTYGQGTTFTLRLPAYMPEQQTYEDGSAVAGQEEKGERQTVLVIDDDPAQRDLMVRFLERQNFTVRTASNGPSGLEIARMVRPRAITLDVMMPHVDGWAVLSALKADPELAKIPVVMVTFHSDKGLSAALGAAEHVDKPVQWDKLRRLMERFRDADGDVLVVDDDPGVRERLRRTLERQGWSVVEAADGREALAKVVHGPPRAILLDLTMPVMDGFAFLHDLRERPGCADIPVIVFSARELSTEDRNRLHEADRILAKTTSLKDVTAELRVLVPTPVDEPGP